MGKEFNLNIGASEDAGKGKGSSGFSFKHTMNMKKAFGKHLTGTDVMSDGYYNQVNKVEGIEGGGSGINMNVPGPMYNKEPKKDEFGTEIPEDFVDDSGRGGVTGTLQTKAKEIDVNEPSRIGRKQDDGTFYEGVPRKGDKISQSNIYRGGKKADLKITDTKRTKTGREKPGKMGKSTVELEKGDIIFS